MRGVEARGGGCGRHARRLRAGRRAVGRFATVRRRTIRRRRAGWHVILPGVAGGRSVPPWGDGRGDSGRPQPRDRCGRRASRLPLSSGATVTRITGAATLRALIGRRRPAVALAWADAARSRAAAARDDAGAGRCGRHPAPPPDRGRSRVDPDHDGGPGGARRRRPEDLDAPHRAPSHRELAGRLGLSPRPSPPCWTRWRRRGRSGASATAPTGGSCGCTALPPGAPAGAGAVGTPPAARSRGRPRGAGLAAGGARRGRDVRLTAAGRATCGGPALACAVAPRGLIMDYGGVLIDGTAMLDLPRRVLPQPPGSLTSGSTCGGGEGFA